jgi:hypothetical protein
MGRALTLLPTPGTGWWQVCSDETEQLHQTPCVQYLASWDKWFYLSKDIGQ